MAAGFSYRVLVVDDDTNIQQISRIVFEQKGYEVRTAADGFEALVELRRSTPDLIVSDLTMPNMSGFELLSVVRRRFPHIPVIAISGEFNGDSPAGLIADAFFPKGQYAPEELFRKIGELLEQAPLRPHAVKPTEPPSGFPVVRRDISSLPVPTVSARSQFQRNQWEVAPRGVRVTAFSAARLCAI